MRWKTMLLIVPLLALVLTGCGRPMRERGLQLDVAVAVGGLLPAPLYLGVKVGRIRITPQRMPAQSARSALESGRAIAAVLSPVAANALGKGYLILMRLASRSDEMLLWRSSAVFHWADLRGSSVLASASARPLLKALLARYQRAVKENPVFLTGTPQAFWRNHEGAFLLVHEPMATALSAQHHLHRAVSLGVEAGPYPAAVLTVKKAFLQKEPQLMAYVIRRLWANTLRLRRSSVESVVKGLTPYYPGVSSADLGRSLRYARSLGVFPEDPRVLRPVGTDRLAHTFPEQSFTSFKANLDDRLADEVLTTTG